MEKLLSLNDYRPITHWIEQFLLEQEGKTSEHTWISYSRSLELWRLYLDSYYGETYLGELEWAHLEEFLAWWYFRHYLGNNYKEVQVLLITLENFAHWLRERKIILETLWQEEAGQALKQDIKKVFDWNRNRALKKSIEEDNKPRLARDTGWFSFIELDSDSGLIMNLLTDQEYHCSLQDNLSSFLRNGDTFSGYIWREKGKTSFLDKKSIRSLYPRAAQKYFR